MKTISEALQRHLQNEVTTLATCWKLTRRDGTMMGFADSDADITFAGMTYHASAALQASAITTSIGLTADNFDLEGVLSDDAITEADILAGRYDYAEINCFMVNYNDTSMGALPLTTGWFGAVTLKDGQFVTEVRGIGDALQHTIGEHYSPTCRATLGDARCKVALAGYTVTGSVSSISGVYTFTDAGRGEASGYFAYGTVTFTSGANQNITREIKRFDTKTFTSFQPWPYPIAVGDSYSAVAGCDKTLSSCIGTFNNAVNFRGEPHVPGTDAMLETSATRKR
jgi:uncharacterized phage protein (TIGR02218 family)